MAGCFAFAAQLVESPVVLAFKAGIVTIEQVEGASLVGEFGEGAAGALGGKTFGLFAELVVEDGAFHFPKPVQAPQSLDGEVGEFVFAEAGGIEVSQDTGLQLVKCRGVF